MKILFLCLALLAMTGCATVTATPDSMPKTASNPTFEETQHFFLWGLTPSSRHVDAREVCEQRDVRQVQAQTTFINGLLGAVTLGIYAPRTLKIWCTSGGEA